MLAFFGLAPTLGKFSAAPHVHTISLQLYAAVCMYICKYTCTRVHWNMVTINKLHCCELVTLHTGIKFLGGGGGGGRGFVQTCSALPHNLCSISIVCMSHARFVYIALC